MTIPGEEICDSCGARITLAHRAMLRGEKVLCEQCYALSDPNRIEVEDRAGRLPPKPTQKLFTITRVETVAVKRIKLIAQDRDTSATLAEIIEVPDELGYAALSEIVERHVGAKLKKVIVLDRLWIERSAPSKLEKSLFVAAIYGAIWG